MQGITYKKEKEKDFKIIELELRGNLLFISFYLWDFRRT